jgi:hypothetical protein
METNNFLVRSQIKKIYYLTVVRPKQQAEESSSLGDDSTERKKDSILDTSKGSDMLWSAAK